MATIRQHAHYSETNENWNEKFSQLHSPSEKEKQSEDYLFFWTDYFIAQTSGLSRLDVIKAYAQRQGRYDPFRVRRINLNFGILTPSEVSHIPIIEPYWRRMQGTHKSTPIRFSVTSHNTQSLLEKRTEKAQHITELFAGIESQAVHYAWQGIEGPAAEQLLSEHYHSAQAQVETIWRSELEIQSQHALNYLVDRCRVVDVADDLFDDYGTCRYAVFQCKAHKLGQMPVLRALDPRHLWVAKHTHTKWISQADSYVYRELLLVSEVIQQYGEYLEADDIRLIESKATEYYSYNNYLYGLHELNPFKNDPDFEAASTRGRYVEVWYVEWKANNRKEDTGSDTATMSDTATVDGPDSRSGKSYRQDRYECTRIGQSVYLNYGKSTVVLRDKDDADRCYLTIDGLIYNHRFGCMDSLWQKCQPLNDDYDVYKYHFNNYIARSGHKSTPIVLEAIPKHYGMSAEERIYKWYQYEKEGIVVFSAEDERALSLMQSIGGVRDRTISRDIMTLAEIMSLTEQMIAKILGPNSQSLGDIGQNDGKGTTELAVANFLMVTQDIFMDMHHIKQVMLTTLLNTFRLAFPEGFNLSYGAEGKQVFFETNKKFSLASFNVFLSNTGEEKATLELFKQIAVKMADSGELDKHELTVVLGAKSVSELQRDLFLMLQDKKNQLVSNLQNQLSDYDRQLKELKRQIAVNQQAENENNARKLNIEAQKVQVLERQGDTKLQNEAAFRTQQLALDTKRVNLESEQLLIGNKSNQEVRNK